MKKITLLFLLFTTIFGFAQKVKEKDGQIFIDDVPVVKVEDTKKFEYKFSNLNDSKSLIVFRKSQTQANNVIVNTLIITDTESGKSTEVLYNPVSISFNVKKSVAEVLVIRHKLVTANGIENLSSFFEQQEKAKVLAKENNAKENALFSKRVDELNGREYFAFDDNNVFYLGRVPANLNSLSPEEKSKYFENAAGTYKVSTQPSTSGPGTDMVVDIFTFNDKLLAHGRYTTYGFGHEPIMNVALDTKQLKAFSYKPGYKYEGNNKENFINELLNKCALDGNVDFVTFAESKVIREKMNAEKELKYQEALKNSANFNSLKGYAVDSEGVKKEGKLSLIFENIERPGSSSNSMIDLDGGPGTSLKMLGNNEKGEIRSFIYKAKNTRFFVITKEGNLEEKYVSLLVKIDNPEDLISLSSSSWKYFKEIVSKEKIGVYQDFPSKTYVIKVANQEKGFQILKREGKEGKFLAKLSEYLGGVVKTADLEKIDYNKIEGINDLVDLYSKSI